jgi:signal transduction histidine kinase
MRQGDNLIREGWEITHANGEITDLAPGKYVEVRITDSGIGMDADRLMKACEPFFTTKPYSQEQLAHQLQRVLDG